LFCGIEHAGEGVDDEVAGVVEEDDGGAGLGELCADELHPASDAANTTISIDTSIRMRMTCSLLR